jgi:hypothetical protein
MNNDDNLFEIAEEKNVTSDKVANYDHMEEALEEQKFQQRGRMFWVIVGMMIAIVAASILAIGVYFIYVFVKPEPLNGSVLVAFFASVVVEIIGLGHIVTRNLFPQTQQN